jgi:uncharacterized membrane protein YtjA (UPF0391 family)
MGLLIPKILRNCRFGPGSSVVLIFELGMKNENRFKNLNYTTMLRWSVIFFVVAIIAAIFGFGGIAEGAASIAQILFFIFLALFVITILFGASLFKK